MREINSSFTNKLTYKLWIPMHKFVEQNMDRRSSPKRLMELQLHDRLEGRIKYAVMIPLEWKLNTLLER
jgi:hypothetical protein